MSMRPVRVVIADDQPLFRSGLAQLLRGDTRVDVVGEAAGGDEAVSLCEAVDADVVLMDLAMPGVDGIDATRQLVNNGSRTKVLILTTFPSDDDAIAALRAGASGYVLKDSVLEAIVCSIMTVHLGDQVISRHVATQILATPSNTDGRRDLHENLTPREVEILVLIGDGVTNKQIARRLGISDKTVRNHLSHIYEKLSVNDRSQAVLYMSRKGMVSP